MNTHAFSFRDMIKSAWHIFKPNLKLIWLAGIVTLIIQTILQIISNNSSANGSQNWIVSIVVFIFVFVIGVIIKMGWSKVFLGLVRHDVVTWNTFKTDSKVWLQCIKVSLWYLGYFVAYTLMGALLGIILIIIGQLTGSQVVTIIGTVAVAIAFIVSAIYFGVRYQFMNFAVLDYPELSSLNVFRKAGAITKGSFWRLLGFNIILVLFNLLGLVCIVIGLAFTVPTSKIAMTKVYELLKGQHEHVA